MQLRCTGWHTEGRRIDGEGESDEVVEEEKNEREKVTEKVKQKLMNGEREREREQGVNDE